MPKDPLKATLAVCCYSSVEMHYSEIPIMFIQCQVTHVQSGLHHMIIRYNIDLLHNLGEGRVRGTTMYDSKSLSHETLLSTVILLVF